MSQHLTDYLDANNKTILNIPISEFENIDFRTKRGTEIKNMLQMDIKNIKSELKQIKKTLISSLKPTIPTTIIRKRKIRQEDDSSKRMRRVHLATVLHRNLYKWCKMIFFQNRGVCYFQNDFSNNQCDPITLDNLSDIKSIYFISFKDTDQFYYSFDIRYFNKSSVFVNPFTRKNIDVSIQKLISKRLEILKNHKVCLEYDDNPLPITTSQRAVSLFTDMDNLDYYTNVQWFLELKLNKLQQWYIEAEDIWNYRANIEETQKKRIIKSNKLFHIPISSIRFIFSTEEMRDIVLKQINILINTADDRNDRKLGCMYVLLAFSEVSWSARNALSWLF